MKLTILAIAILATSFSTASFGQADTKQPQLSLLLTQYYSIKNALVAGDAVSASSNATAFLKNATAVDPKIISEDNIHMLAADAGKIADAKDIKKQREYFSSFSTNMSAVAKVVKLSDEPVYLQYCPMKKASWLSNEKAIRNPYYGNAMLTCGSVTGTL